MQRGEFKELSLTIQSDKPVKWFLKLPYAGKKSENFAHRLKILVAGHFPQVDFYVAFKAPQTIGELFPFVQEIA